MSKEYGQVEVRRNQDQRSHNRTEIVRLLRRSGRLDRSQIAKATTLSLQAVGDILNSLIETGVVSELSERIPGRGRGRPSYSYECNPRHHSVISVYLGERYSQLVISDAVGRPLVPMTALSARPSPSEIFDEIAVQTIRCFDDQGLDLSRATLCLALHAGPSLDPALVNSEQLGWHSVDAIGSLERALPGVRIMIVEASHAAAVAEYYDGQASSAGRVAVINYGPATTCTTMRWGKIEEGAGHLAGAIGRCIIPFEGGSRTIDEVLSGKATLTDYKARTGRQLAWASDLVVLAENGDEDAQAIRDAKIEALAIAATWLAAIVDPDLVVLTGIGSEFYPAEQGRFEARCAELLGHTPERRMFVVSTLGRHAWVTGGTYLALAKGDHDL